MNLRLGSVCVCCCALAAVVVGQTANSPSAAEKSLVQRIAELERQLNALAAFEVDKSGNIVVRNIRIAVPDEPEKPVRLIEFMSENGAVGAVSFSNVKDSSGQLRKTLSFQGFGSATAIQSGDCSLRVDVDHNSTVGALDLIHGKYYRSCTLDSKNDEFKLWKE